MNVISTSRTIKTFDGFEYFNENNWGTWSWYFRPVGAPFFASADGPKAKFFAFLSDTKVAIAFYEDCFERAQNLDRAIQVLDQARSFHERVKHPDWDPGGSANNPGKVARAMREAAQSPDNIKSAELALEQARELKEKITESRFSFPAWRSTWEK